MAGQSGDYVEGGVGGGGAAGKCTKEGLLRTQTMRGELELANRN